MARWILKQVQDDGGFVFKLGLSVAPFTLAACGPTAPPPTISAPPPLEAGLDRVMDKDAAALLALFGDPDLDIREGPARKLQFASPLCVLDAYLYPRPANVAPHVTYIETRRPDGGDIDKASCIAALARRVQAR